MNWTQRIREVILLGTLFLIALLRLSPEDSSATRRTWIWYAFISIGITTIYLLNYKRVHGKYISFLLISILFLLVSMIVATHSPHLMAFLFVLIPIGFVCAASPIVTKEKIHTLALTMLCGISLYAQWGVLQFIMQHDLHMQFVGESVLNIHTSGVASFYIGGQKFIRAYGPFGHANSLSGVILIGCIVLIATYKRLRVLIPNTTFSFFIYSITGTFILGLLTTFSRAAILGGIAIAVYIAIVQKKKRALIVFIPIIIFIPLLLGRSTDSHDVAAHDRIEGLTWGIQMENSSSLLRGYGIGNYQDVLQSYLTRHNIQHYPWDIAPIHSVPLYLLSSFGIIFFSLMAIAIFYTIKKKNLWMLLFLLPPLLVDHYFITQLGPLIWLSSCAIILSHVY